MPPNLFNAREVLRRLFADRERIPFTPIQAFGLPLNEYQVASPLNPSKLTEDSNVNHHR